MKTLIVSVLFLGFTAQANNADCKAMKSIKLTDVSVGQSDTKASPNKPGVSKNGVR